MISERLLRRFYPDDRWNGTKHFYDWVRECTTPSTILLNLGAGPASKQRDRQFKGETVDWRTQFSDELYVGIDTFRECVDAWYTGALQRIIFNRPKEMNDITRQLTSVLAGYAWDRENIFVKSPKRTMSAVEAWCAP